MDDAPNRPLPVIREEENVAAELEEAQVACGGAIGDAPRLPHRGFAPFGAGRVEACCSRVRRRKGVAHLVEERLVRSPAVAALLARSDSDTMAMIGTGSQAAFQALAFRELLGIRRLRVWDTDPAALDTFSAHARGLGFELYQATSASDAATGADIITTCTADKRNARVLDSVDVAPGVHVNAVGGDCPGKTELDPAILERGDVFVEYAPQTRIEGEIQHQTPDFPVTEVWRVFRGEAPGRTTEEQITVFDSVGFALADFSMLHVLADAAAARDLGTLIDLTADPDDPKDLFALVAPAPVPTR